MRSNKELPESCEAHVKGDADTIISMSIIQISEITTDKIDQLRYNKLEKSSLEHFPNVYRTYNHSRVHKWCLNCINLSAPKDNI